MLSVPLLPPAIGTLLVQKRSTYRLESSCALIAIPSASLLATLLTRRDVGIIRLFSVRHCEQLFAKILPEGSKSCRKRAFS